MKTPYHITYVIADDYWKANEIFKKETGFDFNSSICDCCGPDFFITEIDSIENEEWDSASPKLKVLKPTEIKPSV